MKGSARPITKWNRAIIVQGLAGKKYSDRLTFREADRRKQSLLQQFIPASSTLNGVDWDTEFT
ncbi:hypothetical protein D3C73_989100 [compost metagenome]